MDRIMLYPFSDEAEIYIKYHKLFLGHTISSLVCLKGAGYKGRKYLVDKNELTVTEDFDEELKKCDAILPLFVDSDVMKEDKNFVFLKKDKNEIIIENLEKAIKCDKKIFVLNDGIEKFEKLKAKISREQKLFVQSDVLDEKDKSFKQFQNIKTPIIYIASVFEGLGKMEVLLSVYNELAKRKYQVLAFGTKPEGELLGIHSYPQIMYDEQLTDNQKILFLNNYVKRMELKYNPDLILFGVPGGTAPFSAKAPLDFGTTFYKMMRAVFPDYLIVALPYAKYGDTEYRCWNDYYEKNFGVKVDSFNISPKSILQQMIERNNVAHYLTVDREDVKNKLKDNIFSYLFEESVSSEVDKLIQQLKQYVNVISI